jgi:hypothetical protein
MQQPYSDAAKTAGENPGQSYTSSYYEGGGYPHTDHYYSNHTPWPSNYNAGYEASYTVEVNPAPAAGNSVTKGNPSAPWKDTYPGGATACLLPNCRANNTSHPPTTTSWPEAPTRSCLRDHHFCTGVSDSSPTAASPLRQGCELASPRNPC